MLLIQFDDSKHSKYMSTIFGIFAKAFAYIDALMCVPMQKWMQFSQYLALHWSAAKAKSFNVANIGSRLETIFLPRQTTAEKSENPQLHHSELFVKCEYSSRNVTIHCDTDTHCQYSYRNTFHLMCWSFFFCWLGILLFWFLQILIGSMGNDFEMTGERFGATARIFRSHSHTRCGKVSISIDFVCVSVVS